MSMATSSYIYRPHDHYENEDVSIDMQYAKHDCRNPLDFAKEPWEHCRDATNTYLSLRFEKRDHFKSKLTTKQRKRVEHEISRIEQTRVNFSSNAKKEQLMLDLKRARKAWKTEVKENREDYVKEVKEKQPPDPAKYVRFSEEIPTPCYFEILCSRTADPYKYFMPRMIVSVVLKQSYKFLPFISEFSMLT
jgi:hypothetical protein